VSDPRHPATEKIDSHRRQLTNKVFPARNPQRLQFPQLQNAFAAQRRESFRFIAY
jgi:hypothetical protein